MLSSVTLSGESVNLLQQRKLSNQQIDKFAALLDKANDQLEEKTTAKQVLSGLSDSEMRLLQKATGLAQPINVDQLSREGATNLLAQPDKTGMVDINNDGIVEIGAAKMMSFPPVNAPASVQQAWDNATENLPEEDKLMLQLHMHIATNGIQIEGITEKKTVSAEQQWSSAGIKKLFMDLRSGLDFSVARDGWTQTNLMHQDFYNNFESELAKQMA